MRKMYRVYFQYKAEGAAGPEYFWKFYATNPRMAKRQAVTKYEDRITILQVVEE